jgi:dephospho-CoA kinase
MSIRKVGLTGGIGTGKSYCLARFARKGVPTIDADMLARTVVARGEPAWIAVRERFGDGVLHNNGELDRERLGALVFGDPAARRALEAIIHPAVYTSIRAWYESLPDRPPHFAVADIPLLFETGHEAEFDRIVATWCPEAMQIERLEARNGLSEEEARQRLAAQMPADEKRRRAHHVIRTDGSFAETDRQIDELIALLKS